MHPMNTSAWIGPILWIACPCYLIGQGQTTTSIDPKAFEAGASYAQSLVQLSLLIAGGTIAILVGSSYIRPKHRGVRYAYFLFVFGWIFLGLSMYYGFRTQRDYLGYLWAAKVDPHDVLRAMNTDAYKQLSWMERSLVIFGLWLLVYLIWWVLHKGSSQIRDGGADGV